MTELALIVLIAIPALAGALALYLPKKMRGMCAIATSAITMLLAIALYNREAVLTFPWAGFGMDFSLRLYHFSSFIILAASFFALLISLYCLEFMKDKDNSRKFYAYFLISLSFIYGATLADNLVVLLFFWEGLLLTLYGLIATGGRKTSSNTAMKALVIVGISDLCMMAGIGLTGYLAGTLAMHEIRVPLDSLGSLAFVLLMIGAISKAGAIPFHTWIPDAAEDAPLPFMAFFPATMEKLLGIYFLARITLDMFELNPYSALSIVVMAIGAATIIIAVMMALIQKDYKRLLSYHAISQVGYMILGIGTCVPAGIVGGIFHMLNHALYKCGLFLTGGAVEKQSGTTDLHKLGGLQPNMPVTFVCFAVTAASISGVPPFNGFFSKELVYDAALERGVVFYVMAILGSFFTAASFLKLGHAAYLGKMHEEHKGVKEAPALMLIPMIVLALTCTVFGLFNRVPIENFVQPILGGDVEGHHFSGLPTNLMLIVITVLVLLGAFIHHRTAARIKGAAVRAADHIHYAPVLSVIYDLAEKRYFDPYEILVKLVHWMSRILWWIDRGIDWLYNSLVTKVALVASRGIRRAHAGYYVIYVTWLLAGAILVMLFVLK